MAASTFRSTFYGKLQQEGIFRYEGSLDLARRLRDKLAAALK